MELGAQIWKTEFGGWVAAKSCLLLDIKEPLGLFLVEDRELRRVENESDIPSFSFGLGHLAEVMHNK